MHKYVYIVFLLLNFFAIFPQVKISGVEVPAHFKTEEATLVLNGAGVREKYYKDLFVLALYIKAKTGDAHAVMHANEHMAFRLYDVSVFLTTARLESFVDDGFYRATQGKIEPILNEINQFKAALNNNMKKGDVFDFIYHPEKGTQIFKNNILLTTIQGIQFKKALFGIWLYEKLPDSDIHDKLMGK